VDIHTAIGEEGSLWISTGLLMQFYRSFTQLTYQKRYKLIIFASTVDNVDNLV